jgi:DNA polymerase
MNYVILDLETRSKTDLKKGVHVYAPDAEILCLSYSLDGGETAKIWRRFDPAPRDLFKAIEAGWLIHAHNASFERNIWTNILVKKHNWPQVPFEQWRCTMAESYAAGLPGALADVAKALKLDIKKDAAGKRIMQMISKPRKPSKEDPDEWFNDVERFNTLYKYCQQDVRAEAAIHHTIPRLTPYELKVYQLDQRINDRGLRIDVELAKSAQWVWEEHKQRLNKELATLTNGEVKSADELTNLKRFVRDQTGLDTTDMSKDGVENLIEQTGEVARRALEIRRETSLSSVAKYKKMMECRGPDDRIRGTMQYHGAQTGRFAGRLIQIQNFPRGIVKGEEVERLISLVKNKDMESLYREEIPLGDILSSLLRAAIIPSEGKRFIICDYAAIEARGLAWLAREQWLIDAFSQGKDVYVEMAANNIYRIPAEEVTKDQRFYGKTSILGCFAEDTEVLTDSGWKRIVDVTSDDLVWDGEEWVSHDGVIDQGRKVVLERYGVRATPGHKVLVDGQWVPWVIATNDCCYSIESKCQVYDILNAGPRHRFMIRSLKGHMIVHNCGYQMGGEKFYRTLTENFGVTDVTEDFAKGVVEAYRNANQNIVKYWKFIQMAAIKCVKTREKVEFGAITFEMIDRWLCMHMPSGNRSIRYLDPTLVPGRFGGEQIQYTALNWQRQVAEVTTYGGKLTENACQGVCRDLLVDAIFRLEKAGYKCVGHVHDEVILEADIGFGSLEEVQAIMSQTPSWAKGLPVAAEGAEVSRYEK